MGKKKGKARVAPGSSASVAAIRLRAAAVSEVDIMIS
jgi:hypothetical protein